MNGFVKSKQAGRGTSINSKDSFNSLKIEDAKKKEREVNHCFFLVISLGQMSLPSASLRHYQLDRETFSHLLSSQLLYLISLFKEHEYDIRLVGGAVRDIPLGVTPHDIDLATTATTDDMLTLIEGDSNIELVHTRVEHFGTLTLVVGSTARVSKNVIR